MSTVEIAAKDVKALRERTGAGMMDCKKALTEAQGDIGKAIEILRVKQGKKIQDLGERAATEGTVQAYVHAGSKVGVLVCVADRACEVVELDLALPPQAATIRASTKTPAVPAIARVQDAGQR